MPGLCKKFRIENTLALERQNGDEVEGDTLEFDFKCKPKTRKGILETMNCKQITL